ncbi:cytidine deaminase [Spiroplasma endosymbiont of Amphibalanus improvisus]|uniref:cytidine deaminase n=1 Tax=Spiroplasma endosymbiont of Amphibalanus improvisus TaxID=3066327 RepID=UPI00313ACB1F
MAIIENEIFKRLKKLKQNSYAPYSKFQVAAIVEVEGNKLIYGVNVENASYPVGICAERTALSQVYSQGYKKNKIVRMYLIGSSIDFTFPCGMCRQFINETMNPEIQIILFKDNGDYKEIKVSDLLPWAFKGEDLI